MVLRRKKTTDMKAIYFKKDIAEEIHTCNNGEPCAKCDAESKQ